MCVRMGDGEVQYKTSIAMHEITELLPSSAKPQLSHRCSSKQEHEEIHTLSYRHTKPDLEIKKVLHMFNSLIRLQNINTTDRLDIKLMQQNTFATVICMWTC